MMKLAKNDEPRHRALIPIRLASVALPQSFHPSRESLTGGLTQIDDLLSRDAQSLRYPGIVQRQVGPYP
jgi:hypothetical protein